MSTNWTALLESRHNGTWSLETWESQFDSSQVSHQVVELARVTPALREDTSLYKTLRDAYWQPSRETWQQLLELAGSLSDESDEFYGFVDSLLDEYWPAWTRQVIPSVVDAFFAPDSTDPRLRWFRGMDLGNLNEGSAEFAATPHVQYLTHLRVNIDFIPEAWSEMASSSHIGGLTHVSLTGGLEDSIVFVREANTPNLQWLDLCSCCFPSDSLVEMAAMPHLSNLRHLDLGMNPDWGPNQIDDEGLAAIAGSEYLTKLEYLDVSSNEEITDEGIATLVNSPNAKSLKTLHISWTFSLGDDAVEAITNSENLQDLEVLTISGNANFNKVSLKALLETENLPSLKVLEMIDTAWQGRPNYHPDDTNDYSEEDMEKFVQEMAERGVRVQSKH